MLAFPRKSILLSLLLTTSVVSAAKWYEEMNIGPLWSNTFSDVYQGNPRTGALKGMLVDLGDGNRALFDTETLRLVTAYKGGFQWGGTPWTGEHGKLVTLKNEQPVFNTAAAPGWADAAGSFEDKRPVAEHGNLPHASFKGFFRHGQTIVFDYTVNGTKLLETVASDKDTLTRSFKAAARNSDLVCLVADEPGAFTVSADGVSAKSAGGLEVGSTGGAKLAPDPKNPNRLLARIAKGTAPVSFQIALARGAKPQPAAAPDFKALVAGGPPLYPEIIETKGVVSTDTKAPYVTDVATLPMNNPWKANMRFGGFDFINEDSAALSSWNGDVWVVRGLKGDWSKLKWQRIASGLFETLGVKVVKGAIYVNGRDQITQLIDLNGDGETDHFKVFNRDILISKNFHEFAFDLQTDKQGNFYFSKGSPVKGGGRGFDTIYQNHGVVVKITPDGSKMKVIATGLRAPGGLGVGPNGEITTGENEGTWQPCCKINYFDGKKPAFFGTEPARHFLKDAPFTEPLCYLPMDVDNSGGSQVWVPKGNKFGLPADTLLHLSYGQSTVYRVLPVSRGKALQGGVAALPIKLQSAAMRARFHPDGSMYVLGFRGWQTNASSECAFQRVRHNAQSVVPVPEKLEYTATGVRLKFPVKLDAELAADPASYSAQRWNYVRGSQYGSGEFSVDQPDEAAEKQALREETKNHHKRDTVAISSAKLLPDGSTVELELAGMKPSMQLKVTYDLEDAEGAVIKGNVHATVYPN